ncbi:MAG: toxin-antitoxin system HicB family antitoxin [Caldilineaceae bacterium]|nr:toxin-antitoxin system HicB family antitoxin [Caldilineaceae bacterium]
MSSLNLRLPDSLHDQVRELARQDNVSINQFITLAVAEKVSTLLTIEALKEARARGDRAEFERILDEIAQRPRPAATRSIAGEHVGRPRQATGAAACGPGSAAA